jgi:uncharacterized cupredoxin-like copper-binding protein
VLKHLVAVAMGVSLALVVTACGDDEKPATQTQPSGAAVETVAVSETEFQLDPANPRIEQPGTVEFRVSNDGQTVHALEVEGPSGESKTGDIQPGESATLTANLDKPGTYEWYCPIGNHRQQGMEGEITVGGGAGTGTTTTNTTDTNTTETNTTDTNTTETNTTTTNTTETNGGSGSGGSGSGGSGGSGSGGSGSGGSGSGGSGY